MLISLQYKIDNGESKTLVFHKSGWGDTGFIIYKLNLYENENDFLCDSLRKSKPKAIYHYVKGGAKIINFIKNTMKNYYLNMIDIQTLIFSINCHRAKIVPKKSNIQILL